MSAASVEQGRTVGELDANKITKVTGNRTGASDFEDPGQTG
jgi:hypothetical protein